MIHLNVGRPALLKPIALEEFEAEMVKTSHLVAVAINVKLFSDIYPYICLWVAQHITIRLEYFRMVI